MSRLPNPDLTGAGASIWGSSNHILEWSLRPWLRVVLLLIPIIAGGAWLTHEARRAARSAEQLDSHFIPDIQKALRDDPDNPDLLHRMGLAYAYDPTDINLPEAVKTLRKAVALNPRRWEFWSDLGSACDFAGDSACSDDAFERACALNPSTPGLLWAIGNHYLLTDHPQKAFSYFRRLLDLDSDYLDPTFRLCLRATRDPQAIYTGVVPNGKDASARFAFLMFLVSTADYESAMRIWGQMLAGPDRSPNLTVAKPFLDFLIDHNQIQNAGTVWDDLQRAGEIPPGANSQDANVLYDGSFEGVPLNTGFDWRTDSSPDLLFDFSDPSAYKGQKCLKINFAVGRNASYDLVGQVVRIKPNTQYRLSAYVRSNYLTSSSGPRLRVVEMGCQDCTAQTSDPTLGTTPWHPVGVSFTTRPQTQAVRVSFWRPQDQMSNRDITGTVWLDDVTLQAVDLRGAGANQQGVQ